MAKNDGGPAFPTEQKDYVINSVTGSCSWHHGQITPGMTMRQWYKGMAIMGLIASCPWDVKFDIDCNVGFAGRIADAMIAEDENGQAE